MSIEAAQQCGVLAVPEVAEPAAFEAAVADADRLLVFCDEDAEVKDPMAALAAAPRGHAARGLIGPEGGFAEDERALLLKPPSNAAGAGAAHPARRHRGGGGAGAGAGGAGRLGRRGVTNCGQAPAWSKGRGGARRRPGQRPEVARHPGFVIELPSCRTTDLTCERNDTRIPDEKTTQQTERRRPPVIGDGRGLLLPRTLTCRRRLRC